MESKASETAECWNARAARELQAARAEEDWHWQRLVNGQSVSNRQPVLDDAYIMAVERADQAKAEMLEAARALSREQAI